MAESVAGAVRPAEVWLAGLTLTLLALAAPVALYLVALSVFGLPHVLWEMAWLRQTCARGLPAYWWLCVTGVIALQAMARLGGWSGALDTPLVVTLDLLTLAALMLTVFLVRRQLRRPSLVLVTALAVAAGLIAGVHLGVAFTVLAILSIAHNFTPLALAPHEARIAGRPLQKTLMALFSLPLLVAVIGWTSGSFAGLPSPSACCGHVAMPSELVWLQRWDAQALTLLPALVLAQCLHYYSVIRLMPQSGGARPWRMDGKWAALAASATLTGYFSFNFSDARGLYAAVAGAHAWLEWPIMLLLAGGFAAKPHPD